MLHPRLTPIGSIPGGAASASLATVGPYGAWSDLAWTTRWGAGACGMYEASWTMPLPPDFSHPLLRRGTMVELMDGPWRIGSPLILSEPAVGAGLDDPWKFTATGIGREVEGESSWYCDDGAGNTTDDVTVAIDSAIANGLRWDGYDATVPAAPFGPPDELRTIGAMLNTLGGVAASPRWSVGQDNILRFMPDPATPSFHVVPGAAALGTADDEYATVVKVRYMDSGTSTLKTAVAPASPSAVELRFGRREFPVDLTSTGTDVGPISAATAQSYADGILVKSKGRLGWTNGLTLTSNEILAGGVPADLSLVAETVGTGCMVRLHGIFDDLLETNGNTWLDIIVGEAKLVDGAETILLNPMALPPRTLAAVAESVTRMAIA